MGINLYALLIAPILMSIIAFIVVLMWSLGEYILINILYWVAIFITFGLAAKMGTPEFSMNENVTTICVYTYFGTVLFVILIMGIAKLYNKLNEEDT
jgi:heme/copper-type cytochrome/quinol oxidase subunit 2